MTKNYEFRGGIVVQYVQLQCTSFQLHASVMRSTRSRVRGLPTFCNLFYACQSYTEETTRRTACTSSKNASGTDFVCFLFPESLATSTQRRVLLENCGLKVVVDGNIIIRDSVTPIDVDFMRIQCAIFCRIFNMTSLLPDNLLYILPNSTIES